MGFLGQAYAAVGRSTEALELIGEMKQMQKPRHFMTATVYAALGA